MKKVTYSNYTGHAKTLQVTAADMLTSCQLFQPEYTRTLREVVLQKFDGKIVLRARDSLGEIIVVDNGPHRTLHFDNNIKQSAIIINQPAHLVIPYTRAMMAALAFGKPPRKALFIGIGGAAMIRFLHCLYPECYIDAVDLRQLVIDVAETYFELPRTDPLLQCHRADGRAFLRRGNLSGYDLIFVDAFNENGPAAIIEDEHFFISCRNALTADGILVVNLWTRPDTNFPDRCADLRKIFQGCTFELLLKEYRGNGIVYGFNNPTMMKGKTKWRHTAKLLQKKAPIGFERYVNGIIRQNFSFFQRLTA